MEYLWGSGRTGLSYYPAGSEGRRQSRPERFGWRIEPRRMRPCSAAAIHQDHKNETRTTRPVNRACDDDTLNMRRGWAYLFVGAFGS
jgi:hypothetical protein